MRGTTAGRPACDSAAAPVGRHARHHGGAGGVGDHGSARRAGAGRWRRDGARAAAAVLSLGLVLAACTTTGSGGGTGSGGSSPAPQPDPYPAAVQGPGPNGSFYDVPSAPAGSVHGQLLYYEPAPSDATALPNTTDWTVAYVSTDAQGKPDVVTGTVIVPTAPWPGPGPRPVVDYAVGTQGIGPSCAPSKLFGTNSEYESVNIDATVAKGYAVVATDYQWSGTTDTPPATYVAGLSEGHAVLDMARVGAQIPGSGLSFSAPTVVWGYSQGGGAATWAGQLWPSYQPKVDLVGVAAGGVPGNLIQVGESLDGGAFAGLAGIAIIGMANAYPDLPFTSLLNTTGKQLVAKLDTACVAGDIIDGAGMRISQVTSGSLTLQQVLKLGNWQADLLQNSPGQPGATIDVPTFMYRGDVDEIIPTSVEDQVYATLCSDGTVIQSATFPGEHALTLFEAQGAALTFIAQRLAGDQPTNSCTTNGTSL